MNENSVATEVMAVQPESKILSLVEVVTKKYDEMIEICQMVEHNKEVHELLSKIEKIDMALSNLRIHKKNNKDYFSEWNYTNLCKLVAVIDKVRENITEISKGHKVEIYRNLNKKFDITVQLLDLNLEKPFFNFLPYIKKVNFLPLVREVTKIHNEIIEVYQTAQYNKKTCWPMMKRVEIAEIALRNVRDNRNENSKYFSIRNYIKLCSLINVIDKIRKFVAKISYYETKNIDETSKYLNDELDSIVQPLKLSLINSSDTIVCTGIETASKVEVLFENFLPLIENVNKFYSKIVKIYETAQYNKKTCEALLERAKIANTAVNNLKIRNLEFFSEKNYKNFTMLVNVIDEVHQYLAKISQLNDYSNDEDIEKNFFKLDDEFKTTLQLLQPFLIINFDASNNDNYDEKIQTDVEEEWIEWIKRKFEDEDIRYFDYGEFSDIEEIGKGGFGVLNRALTNDGMQVALKSLIEMKISKIEEIVIERVITELKLFRMIDLHQNINSFLGIAKDDIGNLIMVLEYANEGNLRDYLKRKFYSLQWENKIRMALDITCGLKWIHSKDIIHRDLQPKNILVNNGRLLIADFGLSKRLTEVTSNSESNNIGMIGYIDPQCYSYENVKYIRDKKSDIYSLGVVFWEITSGRPPFHGIEKQHKLDFHIGQMKLREKPIEGTPSEYRQLYQKCWDDDPAKRPNIYQVYDEILNQLNKLDDNNVIVI